MKRLMRNPYRREASHPELELVLQDEAYFPGDTILGMLRLGLEFPFDMLTLEIEVTGVEKAVVGGFLYTAANPEVRRTVYYQQFITLQGMSHDALTANAALKRSSMVFRPAAYLPTRKDAPPAQFRPMEETSEDGESGELGGGGGDSASRRSSASLYNPSTFGDTSGFDVVQLLPGSYTYPFSVTLPATLPPSRRVVHGRDAESILTYTVTARLVHKNGKSHFKATRNVEVVALSVQLQRWLQLHRRSGNGMSAEDGETATSLSRQTSDVAKPKSSRNNSFIGSDGGDDDDDSKVSLRRTLDHALQFTSEELRNDEEEFQREERRRRKEKKRQRKAGKQETLLTVENVEGLGADGGVAAQSSPSPQPDVDKGATASREEQEEDEDPEKARAEAEKTQQMEALLQLQQWEEMFTLPLRNSVLKKALVGIHVMMNTVVLARGYSQLSVTCMVDNSQGTSSISRMKYSLITRSRVISKKEFFKFDTRVGEVPISQKIDKGKTARVDAVHIPVPDDTPLTMITDGAETRTFLNIRLYVHSPLKTYSRSVDIEVLVTNGVDTRNMSRRLHTWSCYFKNKGLDGKGSTAPCIDLSAQNKDLVVLDGADALLPAASPKAGDGRAQHSFNNFDHPTFCPLDGLAMIPGGQAGHVDPMAGSNPFASQDAANSVEEEEEEGDDVVAFSAGNPGRRSFDVHEVAPSREYPEEKEN